MVSSCHMTSALRTLRSEGHVITLFKYLLKYYIINYTLNKIYIFLKKNYNIIVYN